MSTGGDMIYVFECECGEVRKENLPVSERDSEIICSCGKSMNRVINSGAINFSLKGWGWTGRDYKEKRIREKRSLDMALKQHERYGDGDKLVPNYNGREADSWKEVRDQAVFEKGAQVSNQYESLINKEECGRKSKSDIINETVNDMRSS